VRGITDQAEDSGTNEDLGAVKMFVMEEFREWKERQRISRLEKDFNHIEGLEKISKNIPLISACWIMEKGQAKHHNWLGNILVCRCIIYIQQ